MSHGARRRESFNTVAAQYDEARPEYPPELVADIVRLTGIAAGSRVLEIGCGTGQLSVPLAQQGVSLLAVELGPNLASIARRKLEQFPRARVVVSAFQAWPLPAEPFDLVVAATAFHWLDPEIRVAKSAAALAPGGHLAVVDTRWGVGRERDQFSAASQACYARWDPHHDPDFTPPTITDLPTSNPDLEAAQQFGFATLYRYEAARRYTAKSYCDLLGTWSNILGMAEEPRAGLLDCIRQLIDAHFGGSIVRHDLHELWLCRKVAAPGPVADRR